MQEEWNRKLHIGNEKFGKAWAIIEINFLPTYREPFWPNRDIKRLKILPQGPFYPIPLKCHFEFRETEEHLWKSFYVWMLCLNSKVVDFRFRFWEFLAQDFSNRVGLMVVNQHLEKKLEYSHYQNTRNTETSEYWMPDILI